MSERDLWQAVLAQIELDISPASFATWFKNTKAKKVGNVLDISVPNSFVKEWLENKYEKKILSILHSIDSDVRKLEFSISKSLTSKSVEEVEEVTEQPSFQVLKRDRKTGLNPTYTFSNFVVGSFNELAHAAATAVAEELGHRYNPLFLYGRVGLGKTHLLQAIGNDAVIKSEDAEVKYITSENLVSQIVNAIRNGTIGELKDELKKIDVLIVDDVQFISGKEKTQEEFFHIFNTLYQGNKQIILSSDRPPKAIADLAKRLQSRFEGGMIVDISYPDLETRMAILSTKAQEKGSKLSKEVCEFLAVNIKTNIRELEGALNRIILYEKVKGERPSMEKIEELVRDFIVGSQEKLTPDKIVDGVSEYYNISKDKLMSESRKKEIVRPRQVAMYFMRHELDSSYPAIARFFGGRDHTTAIYACKKIDKKIQNDEDLRKDVKMIKMRFLNV